MEQIILKGIISATSKKQSDKIIKMKEKAGQKHEPRKAIWLTLTSDDEIERAVEFGLTPYVIPDEDTGETITSLVIQSTNEIDLYNLENEVYDTIDGGITGDNFNSDDKEIEVVILSDEGEFTNKWFRLKAIKGEIKFVEKRNLFAPQED